MVISTNGAGADEPSPKLPKLSHYDPLLKIKKLSDKAVVPSRASALSAGYDLSSAVETKVPGRGKALVPTDLSIAIPEGTYARIAPRSGLAWKHSIGVGAGVIDADYRGPVGVVLFNHSDVDFEVKPGDRIAQMIIERIMTPDVIEVEDLDSTVRGVGGFGSTGVLLTGSFVEGYSALFGGSNVVRSDDVVQLRLDRYTGSGFISSDYYKYGLFSASIKLPDDYTAGVVVAFYTSNGDVFDKTHDELDFEFLGNVRGKPWRVQFMAMGARVVVARSDILSPLIQRRRLTDTRSSGRLIISYSMSTTFQSERLSEPPSSLCHSMLQYGMVQPGPLQGENIKQTTCMLPSSLNFLILSSQAAEQTLEQLPAMERCMEAESELATAEYAVLTPRERAAMRRFRERYMTIFLL